MEDVAETDVSVKSENEVESNVNENPEAQCFVDESEVQFIENDEETFESSPERLNKCYSKHK